MTENNQPKKGFSLAAHRVVLLASVAGIGAALLFAGPTTNWSGAFNTSTASAADAMTQHPAGFADLVAKVKPAVISVRVKIPASAEPAMMQHDNGDDDNQHAVPALPGSPIDKFFKQFGEQFGRGQ